MNQFSLLATRRFLPLFVAQFLGALNDNIYRFALIILITFTLAEQSALDSGTLVVMSGGIFILPFFLFSAFAGQLADKYEKARLIRYIKFAEIVVMGLGAVGFWLKSTWFLLVVLFLMGTHSAFFGPLKYGILPQHLRDDELTGGNGLIQMATYVAILTGAMLGGMLAAIEGLGPIVVVVCVVGVAFAGWIAACFIPPAPPADAGFTINWRLWRATLALMKHAARERRTLTLVLTNSWFWFMGATFLSMVPTYGKALLRADEQAVTLLNTAFTIGIGCGSLLCETLSRKRVELGLVPLAGLGLSLFAADVFVLGMPAVNAPALGLAGFFAEPDARRFFLDLVGIGACGALYIVPLNAALQAGTPLAYRSRVIAALNVMNALFMVASALFTVVLYQLAVPIPSIFLIVAGMNLAVIATAMALLSEFGERLRRLI